MPNYVAAPRPPLDAVFFALSDSTRRSVLEKLGQGPTPVGELAKSFPMALPSFLQHLRVLESSSLVSSHKVGRVRTYQLAPQPMQQVQSWLSAQKALWEKRLDRLDHFLLTAKEPSP